MTALTGLERWKMRWDRLGVATIPLWSNSKQPFSAEWNVLPPSRQWREANAHIGGQWRGNIGIMPGPNYIVIDSDTPETAATIDRLIDGLGLRPPMETTPRGGTHTFLRVSFVPGDFDFAHLSQQVGKGELRTRHANVVVACSAIGDRHYRMVRGRVEDIATLPVVQWKDLTWLLAADHKNFTDKLTVPPIRLLKRDMPSRARQLLIWLQTAQYEGQTPDPKRYESRHNVEAAVAAILILAGWSRDDIEAEFEIWQPIHYATRNRTQRGKYLERTYRNVLTWLASTPERIAIAESYRAAESDLAAWTGRGGLLERNTYLAMLATCWQFNSWTVRAAELDLAEHATASQNGVHKALVRLEKAARARRLRAYTPYFQPLTATTWYTFPYRPLYPLYCDFLSLSGNSELWSQGMLGRAAQVVYAMLKTTPLKVKEIADCTGRGTSTVYEALARLELHGLAAKAKGGWVVGKSSVQDVAKEWNVEEAATLRHERHKRHREGWREKLVRLKGK